MNLTRQLMLVSLLALLVPWAGCEFIRETESALRTGQQQMLAGTARALANSLSQYVEEYPQRIAEPVASDQLYLQQLMMAPRIDGYIDDWRLAPAALRSFNGPDGPVRVVIARFGAYVYLYVEASDRHLVYASPQTIVLDDGPKYADRVSLISSSPPYLEERFVFAAEAPGPIVSYKRDNYGFAPQPAISAHWQDVPGGYHLEARIPADFLGTGLGVAIGNTDDESQRATRIRSFSGSAPPRVAMASETLQGIAEALVQPGTRAIITDAVGWRITTAGELSAETTSHAEDQGWSQRIYDLLVEAGTDTTSAEPDPTGRERQPYVSAALDGREMPGWFRNENSGRAIVAVAAPIKAGDQVLGALVLQQGTDAILSATNEGLVRLINLTIVATLLVAGGLIAYASWLSRRIRHLSAAAEGALENEALHSALPSALAADEIGDLSRSFSHVLRQLGDYNAYLRTLASKLSHELRTPLAIVTSSLENLEYDSLSESSAAYTTRAREGADRLRHILSAMSEASRVEELMQHSEPEPFDLRAVLLSTVDAYRDVYTQRNFDFDCALESAPSTGSPELLIQMLDKLIDNAVDFSRQDDTIFVVLSKQDDGFQLTVMNPGPALPERMRTQMFDSMVSMRGGENTQHLGLGLYVAKLIAEGHGGTISADNVEGGVVFEVQLPDQDSR